ncbi:MAG: hypothetical protein FJ297_14690 [Planctomycetes bacterium]|nr:hypothetical protein [Planctomycetota bacterium]
MSEQQYVLPCACGRTRRVGASQAGEQVDCECGAKITVPTLRGLRALASAPDDRPHSAHRVPEAGRPSSVAGCLFAFVFLGFITSCVFTAAMFALRARLDPHRPFDAVLAANADQIDRLPIDESYHVWTHYERDGIGGEMPTAEIIDWTRSRMYVRLGAGGGIAAAVLLIAMIAVGWAARSSRSAPPSRRT